MSGFVPTRHGCTYILIMFSFIYIVMVDNQDIFVVEGEIGL